MDDIKAKRKRDCHAQFIVKQDAVCVFVCMCDYVPHAGTQDSKGQKAVGPAEITTWPLIFAVSINLSLPLPIFLPYASVNLS